MERLTSNIDFCQMHCDFGRAGGCFFKDKAHCYDNNIYNRLREYEIAEEQGLLLRLTCPIGSAIWFVGNEFVNDYEVRRYIVDETGIDCVQIAKEIDGRDYWNSFSIDDFGKTVFLTKEEAEQALKQMGE